MLRWLALLCAAALVAGCGSSSSSDEPPPASPTPTVRSGDLKRLPPVEAGSGQAPSSVSPATFFRLVFDDAEAMWQREFQRAGLTYHPARLTVFSHEVHTACGVQSSMVGPFYCPASFGVYLDAQFFSVLSHKAGVHLGDFARAYVIAHELGHHVQTLLGITHQKALADQHDPAGANARSVRYELQADCFAGVWAHSAYRQGDVTEAGIRDALNAAAVVGDDFAPTGVRPPEDWTHGSSAQRQHWFLTGFSQGDPAACDTFSQ